MSDDLCKRLRAPVRVGGTNSEDAYEAYDDLRLEAAAQIERLMADARSDREYLTGKEAALQVRAAAAEARLSEAEGLLRVACDFVAECNCQLPGRAVYWRARIDTFLKEQSRG